MMESCPDKADKQEQVAADVLKGAHLSEVGTLADSQVNQVFYTVLT